MFSGSSRLDAFCVREHRLALAPITTQLYPGLNNSNPYNILFCFCLFSAFSVFIVFIVFILMYARMYYAIIIKKCFV